MNKQIIKHMNITFIRHGTTEYNIQDRVQGSSDIPLSKKGIDDIENVHLTNSQYDAYFHSPLIRSKDTLLGILMKYNIKYDNVNIVESKDITERKYGIFEGLTKKEIQEKYPELYNEWMVNENVQYESIETIENVIGRIQSFVSKLLACDFNQVLAVTHSGFLYALYKFITNQPLHLKPHEIDISFPNCCILDLNIIVYHSYIEFTLKIQNKEFKKRVIH